MSQNCINTTLSPWLSHSASQGAPGSGGVYVSGCRTGRGDQSIKPGVEGL